MRLAGSALAWTKTTKATGVAAREHTVSVRVYLAGRDPAALDAAATAVTTPGSPSYRHFITPAQYAQRFAPTDSFAGHQMNTAWDELHRAYFNGEALWTYLTTPFLLAGDGVHVEETEPWKQDGETWRVLRARFPGSIETHSRIQDFFFDDSRMLRRHDYQVNIAGGFPAAQLTSEHVRVDGISLPTKRRAYTRGPDRRPILDMLMVTIDFSDVKFR